ncbi:hypothetical protein Purlil1_12252 [Purpureocillium lilacinum]|uniref:Uncharacterized protein n=1 Tax=Purpureocillium lilacinum TaxID=33203 RepID=A0ABR0BHD3_PURLI|nr:hypothetical protein Purlil1_12252 [Purpureocillium lilacinum]
MASLVKQPTSRCGYVPGSKFRPLDRRGAGQARWQGLVGSAKTRCDGLCKPREEIPGTADDRGSAAPPCLSAFAASVPAARSKVRGPLDAEPQKARPWREARGRCRGGPCDARSIHADIKVLGRANWWDGMAWHGMGQRARRRSELAWQCPAETRDDGAHGRTLVLVSERDGETIAAGSGRSAAGFDALIFLVLGFGAERGREAGVSSLGPCRWSRLSDFQTCSENSVVPMAWVWRTNPTNPSPFTHLARALDMYGGSVQFDDGVAAVRRPSPSRCGPDRILTRTPSKARCVPGVIADPLPVHDLLEPAKTAPSAKRRTGDGGPDAYTLRGSTPQHSRCCWIGKIRQRTDMTLPPHLEAPRPLIIDFGHRGHEMRALDRVVRQTKSRRAGGLRPIVSPIPTEISVRQRQQCWR